MKHTKGPDKMIDGETESMCADQELNTAQVSTGVAGRALNPGCSYRAQRTRVALHAGTL